MRVYKIMHLVTNRVIFEGTFKTLKDCVETAVELNLDLSYADFSCAELSGANLSNGRLHHVSFRHAFLRYADLRYANISNVCLSRANLHGANLHGADIYKSDLDHVMLDGASFSNDYIIDGGRDYRGHNAWCWRHPNGYVVYRGGCRQWCSLDEALRHFTEDYNGSGNVPECIARFKLIHEIAKSRGWV